MHGDDVAVWYGVVHAGVIEGTIGLFQETSPDRDSEFRLRGMTTAPSIRGTGLGRMLVDALIDRVRSDGGDSVWCAARVEAAGFYDKLRFERVSEEYEVEGLGPHVRMRRAL
jgi:GNAT superfamily N-acetyltransferase